MTRISRIAREVFAQVQTTTQTGATLEAARQALSTATYDGRGRKYSVEVFRKELVRCSAILMSLGGLTGAEIVGERARQDDLWGDSFDKKNTANDWHAYIANYISQAVERQAVADTVGYETNLLKAAALCQAAILMVDLNGAPAPRHYDDVLDHDVAQAIAEERKYQESMSGKKLTVGEELMLMEEYVMRARQQWTDTFGDDTEAPTRDMIRKIITIGVRCLTNHGVVTRKESNGLSKR
jgi:hypothetical protein